MGGRLWPQEALLACLQNQTDLATMFLGAHDGSKEGRGPDGPVLDTDPAQRDPGWGGASGLTEKLEGTAVVGVGRPDRAAACGPGRVSHTPSRATDAPLWI